MRLSVNIVIYFYIFICAVLLLFNLLTILRSANVKRRQKRRVQRWKTYLISAGLDMPIWSSNQLFRRLRHIQELTAFYQAIEDRAKEADLATLTKVFNDCIDDIYTSLDSKDILDLLGNIANYRIVEEEGFPQPDLRGNANMGAKGACVIPTDLVTNVEWLHQFLFEDAAYTVSDSVREYSQRILSDTSPYME